MVKQIMVSKSAPVWYDVTDTLKSGRRTGVQRVVVELARQLQQTGRLRLVRFDPWTGRFLTLGDQEAAAFWQPGVDTPTNSTRTGLSSLPFWKHVKGWVVPWLIQPVFRFVGPAATRTASLGQGLYLCAEILGDPVRIQALRRLRRYQGLRTVHILHDFLPFTHPEWTTLRRVDFARHWNLVRRGSLLVAVSDHTRREAEARLGPSKTPVVTVYPGLSFESTAEPPLPGSPTEPFFACIGTVEDRKNQLGVLRAFREYRDRGGKAALVVAGGPGRGSAEFSSETALAREQGYPVTWITPASDGAVQWLYQHALATVYASFAEGFGLPVLESLGHGTPCITANQTSTGELARAFGGCLLVDPRKTGEITAALLRFDAEPGLRQALKASVRQPLPTWSSFASGILQRSEPVRLLFDVSILGYSELRTQYRTGIFQVAVALLKALSAHPGVELGVYSSSGNLLLCRRALIKAGLGSLPVIGGFWSAHLAFAALVARNGLYKTGQTRLASVLSHLLEQANRFRKAGDRKALSRWQAYLSPMDAVPKWVADHPNLNCGVLIHDLIPLHLPEYAQDPEDPTRWFSNLMRSIRPTDRYFTVSDFTRRDFLNRFPGVPAGHVTVAPNAVDRTRFTPPRDTGSSLPYFLAVSTIEPRKRLDAVLAGFTLYRRAGGTADLVICGSNRQGHRDKILSAVDEALRPFVQFSGYVKDLDLPGLYGRCLAFVSLSEFEGFGLPILEAMSCGAPVIVSDRTSHPEVAGEAGVYVDPDQPQAVAEAMAKMERYPSWRAECSRRSQVGADRFSWQDSAQRIVDRFVQDREEQA